MTETIKTRPLLAPLAALYGLGTGVRNKLFDAGWLREEAFDVPVICVGNLTVGGTGKTPHIEYLIRLLAPRFRVALLSRGYKRKSKGFVMADAATTPQLIGDEPYQIWRKFPDITVAVDANRRRGIRRLLTLPKPPQVILLDDAYQHRYVRPSLSILLSDFNRPYYEDHIMPWGILRESRSGAARADLIVVTKCPEKLSSAEMKEIASDIDRPQTPLFFSTQAHPHELERVVDGKREALPAETEVLLVSAIARPESVESFVALKYRLGETLFFADHHDFTDADVRRIAEIYNSLTNHRKAIIVTEKDAVKLRQLPSVEALKEVLYFLPLEIKLLNNMTERFNQIIIDHVTENQRNS
jgi:tetraacyldisaccharide 4'-kinase